MYAPAERLAEITGHVAGTLGGRILGSTSASVPLHNSGPVRPAFAPKVLGIRRIVADTEHRLAQAAPELRSCARSGERASGGGAGATTAGRGTTTTQGLWQSLGGSSELLHAYERFRQRYMEESFDAIPRCRIVKCHDAGVNKSWCGSKTPRGRQR